MLHLTLKRRKGKTIRICICENYAKKLIKNCIQTVQRYLLKKLYVNL